MLGVFLIIQVLFNLHFWSNVPRWFLCSCNTDTLLCGCQLKPQLVQYLYTVYIYIHYTTHVYQVHSSSYNKTTAVKLLLTRGRRLKLKSQRPSAHFSFIQTSFLPNIVRFSTFVLFDINVASWIILCAML